MKDFKGFDDWIPIFKGGKQTDSQGRRHDGDKIIDKAIETFDPNYHEPPLVIGHPKDNAPAFGWVAGLEKVGDVLYAKMKDVAGGFKDLIKEGLFKKRSASFYPDGRLRHVGFLGATPPAVKGLADMKFKEEGNALAFEFTEQKNPGEKLDFEIKKLMNQSKEFAEDGSEINGGLTYGDAFQIATQQNPELTQEYIESIGLNT